MNRFAAALSAFAFAALAAAGAAVAADHKVAYPAGFRTWDHVKSMVINKGHPLYDAVGGIHHIYGNPKAMQGYKAGSKFADGSVIVFDLFDAVDKDNAVSEGARKAVVVMSRDAKKFASTGGWGYEVFDAKTRKGTLDAKAAADCHGCHTQVKDSGFVFSKLRD
jgi:hypothetical protein